MRRRRSFQVVKFVLIAIAAAAIFGFAIKELWNWLMPELFGWHAITFWQGVGLLALSKLLFGGFRGGPGRGMHWRGRLKERWAHMSEEERAKFSEGMKGRFGEQRCRTATEA